MISVIVPIHNSQLYLEECLSSIKNQRFTDIEVLMINDASTDRSEEICKAFEEKDQRFRLITQAWSGVCVARNRRWGSARRRTRRHCVKCSSGSESRDWMPPLRAVSTDAWSR